MSEDLKQLQRGDRIRVTWLDAVQTFKVTREDIENPAMHKFLATYIVVDEGVFLTVTKSQTGHDVLIMIQQKRKNITTLAIPVSLIIKVEKVEGPSRRPKKQRIPSPRRGRAIIGVRDAASLREAP